MNCMVSVAKILGKLGALIDPKPLNRGYYEIAERKITTIKSTVQEKYEMTPEKCTAIFNNVRHQLKNGAGPNKVIDDLETNHSFTPDDSTSFVSAAIIAEQLKHEDIEYGTHHYKEKKDYEP